MLRILLSAAQVCVLGATVAKLPAAEPARKLICGQLAGNDIHVINTATTRSEAGRGRARAAWIGRDRARRPDLHHDRKHKATRVN